MKNLYHTLGIAPGASQEEIKQAWRVLCRQYHPDREGGSEARMAEVNDAYRILSDPTLRAEYDAKGAVGAKPSELSLEAQAVQVLIGVMHTFTHIRHPRRKMNAIKEQAGKMLTLSRKELGNAEAALAEAELQLRHATGLWETSSDQPNVFDLAAQVAVDRAQGQVDSMTASINGLIALQNLLKTYKLTKAGELVCEKEDEVKTAPPERTLQDIIEEFLPNPGNFNHGRF